MVENGPIIQADLTQKPEQVPEQLSPARDLKDIFLPLTDWSGKDSIANLLEAKWPGESKEIVLKILNEVAWHVIAEDTAVSDLSDEEAVQKLTTDSEQKAHLYNALADALRSDFSALMTEINDTSKAA